MKTTFPDSHIVKAVLWQLLLAYIPGFVVYNFKGGCISGNRIDPIIDQVITATVNIRYRRASPSIIFCIVTDRLHGYAIC